MLVNSDVYLCLCNFIGSCSVVRVDNLSIIVFAGFASVQEESSDNGSVSQGRRSVVGSFSTSEATVPPTNYGAQTLGASGAAYDRTSALAPAGSVAEALASDIPMNNKLVKKKSKKEKDKGSLFKGLGSMFR